MLKCCRSWVMPYIITCVVLYLLAFAILTLYGLIIYFSDDNDCQENGDTSTYLVFMIIFMFFGCILTLLLCVLCIVGPIIYYQFRDAARQPGKLQGEGQIAQVIDGLQRTAFNPQTMKELECCICMEKFGPEDKQITQLKCNETHLFHTECIIGWINEGNNTCPLCREPIQNIEELM